MPRDPLTFDTFEIYRQWCLDHDLIPPQRNWWNWYVAYKPALIDELQFDYELERKHWVDEA